MRNRARRGAVALLAAIGMGACASGVEPGCQPSTLVSCDEVWIQILGPSDWQPEETYSVELAGQALVVDALGAGGIGAVSAPDGGEVRLYEVDTCTLVSSFPVRPGSIHRIRFDDAGRPTITEVGPEEPVELGPGIEPTEASGCGG